MDRVLKWAFRRCRKSSSVLNVGHFQCVNTLSCAAFILCLNNCSIQKIEIEGMLKQGNFSIFQKKKDVFLVALCNNMRHFSAVHLKCSNCTIAQISFHNLMVSILHLKTKKTYFPVDVFIVPSVLLHL